MSRRSEFDERLRRQRVVAIVRSNDHLQEIVPALWRGGIELVEVALTSPGALDAISILAARGEVGAGTVRTREDGQRALDAGASFLVSPAANPDLIGWAAQNDVPHLPGVFTPSEIELALGLGASVLKLFPASVGGPEYVTALRGPFPNVEFVPTGGVDAENAMHYLTRGAIAVGLGGSLTHGAEPEDVCVRAQEVVRRIAV
jgi:2-dehydro-3-deoxyphosphogluconate aldolase/(4S)-4-hydroxy-2-oxoglutarate aldolase